MSKHVREYDPKDNSDDHAKRHDTIRKAVKNRCEKCDTAISDEPEKFHAVFHGGRSYLLCDVCYTMRQAVYFNGGLKNMNYYKELDAAEEAEKKAAAERRKKMGLDGNGTT